MAQSTPQRALLDAIFLHIDTLALIASATFVTVMLIKVATAGAAQ